MAVELVLCCYRWNIMFKFKFIVLKNHTIFLEGFRSCAFVTSSVFRHLNRVRTHLKLFEDLFPCDRQTCSQCHVFIKHLY